MENNVRSVRVRKNLLAISLSAILPLAAITIAWGVSSSAEKSFLKQCQEAPGVSRAQIGGPAASNRYRLILLPTAGGKESYHGGAINNRGEIVGGTRVPSGNGIGFWKAPNADLCPLPLQHGQRDGRVLSLNDAGKLCGYTYTQEKEQTLLWTVLGAPDKPKISVHSIPQLAGFPSSLGTGINSIGHVIGRAYTYRTATRNWWENPSSGYFWDGHAEYILPLPYPVGWQQVGGALAINDHDQIVGWQVDQKGLVRAVQWSLSSSEKAVVQALPELEGSTASRATAINEEGVIAGACTTAPLLSFPWEARKLLQEHAVLWRDGKVFDLGAPARSKGCRSNAINKNNHVVGEYRIGGGRYSQGHRCAFIWDSTHGLRDLNDLLSAPTKWIVQGGLSINDRDEILAYGVSNDPKEGGFVRLYLLIPE